MTEKYEPVRGENFRLGHDASLISLPEGEGNVYIRPVADGEVRFTHEESQLDRIEKKMDRILELLENGDLSTSFSTRNISSVLQNELYKPVRANQF